jgi:adenylate kinase family enzyme
MAYAIVVVMIGSPGGTATQAENLTAKISFPRARESKLEDDAHTHATKCCRYGRFR